MKAQTQSCPEEALRRMLVPKSIMRSRDPYVVAASPLSWREAERTGGGFPELRRTLSDHVGIRGLLHAFGSIINRAPQGQAPRHLPELLDPNDFRDEVIRENQGTQPAHLYCIGSPKANRWTRLLLGAFNECWSPTFEFRADDLSANLRNVSVQIHKGGTPYLPQGFASTDRQKWDMGLVIRGPNPFNERCMFTVFAGRSAIGTEAACYAGTSPKILSSIHRRLFAACKDCDLEDHTQAFFASVHMQRDPVSKQSNLRTLKISEAGFYRRVQDRPQREDGRRYDLFLSHHGAEKEAAQKLAKELESRGLSVWFSESHIKLGAQWIRELEIGLAATRAGLLLVGPSGVGKWQMFEWEILLKRSFGSHHYPLIPVHLPGVRAETLPTFMTMLQTFVLAEGLKKSALDTLARRIREAISAK